MVKSQSVVVVVQVSKKSAEKLPVFYTDLNSQSIEQQPQVPYKMMIMTAVTVTVKKNYFWTVSMR
jgi:hypothetical protein